MSEQFFFEDFYTDPNDPGEEVLISMNGSMIPIVFKKTLDLADLAQAEAAGVMRSIDDKTGVVVVTGTDDVAAAIALLERLIMSWPFVYRDGEHKGEMVPITKQNISGLPSFAYFQLSSIVNKRVAVATAQIGPFVKQSVGASLPLPAVDTSPQAISLSE